MKSKLIVKILGIGVVLAMLASLLVGLTAAPVSAAPGALAWSVQSTPSMINNVLVPGTIKADLFAVSPDGKTVFAYDSTANLMYVSTDGGVTFPTAPVACGTAGALPVAMAISPKYATDGTAVMVETGATLVKSHVWWTTNSGASWVDVANNALTTQLDSTNRITSVDLGYYWATNLLNVVIGVSGDNLNTTTSHVLMFASGSFAWVPFGALQEPVYGVKFSE